MPWNGSCMRCEIAQTVQVSDPQRFISGQTCASSRLNERRPLEYISSLVCSERHVTNQTVCLRDLLVITLLTFDSKP